jgi:hypothetical protein
MTPEVRLTARQKATKIYQNNVHEIVYLLNNWETSSNNWKIIRSYWVYGEASNNNIIIIIIIIIII